ncbi:hypothetical protein [Egicoccus halophilus]|uniref:Tfp pilus assembly protein PilN n=1 Tax=Egicoccus halophilus TaxID=1670830 RepID=A0A8J3ESG5_9ACTN|nr:hypothetical protein [Egicoccus halophilus]GGI07363.1 hypothetical protein GCM10011354_23710 [Egicoccus halophilus]
MSVRVNLLPVANVAHRRASRQRAVVVVALGAVVAALGIVHAVQHATLRGAEAELAAAQHEVLALEGARAELTPYAELAAQAMAAEEQVRAALADEVSVAGLLQDLALVTATETGLETIDIRLQPPLGAAPAVDGVPPDVVGTVTLTGANTAGHAPGVERLLLDYASLVTLADPYVSSSTLDEHGNASFVVDVDVRPSSRTERYADGLPEVLR